ncbi:succinate dehydrogenase [ubiquinone] cytochrome b small subunit, mitochondrial-like [Anopheles bellator]|uniref:succinate dehydrogenase [ubiquinone] cytochrome b small subunit, mitochondrial-like n=1 Tax=Anopheles bellator TaxID=139047 RepID=UPI002649C85B|nr:succinate dehydrogenase [ubiquinone] cytochrome b small subunit, mitochondrial-like [Anopheles bellator]XP_058064640.1 succinate dehydrogenase [ubiquinone] cytochrome b small subunit, mitochondrial-like [Anopheles bellator]XP_058064645.1 succinate dehydrogenase [ubiquinone] cytochrome b small subunit, mitochondrial-like [Anopheles bellator]XP_058064646.1 succinate dehydrogenase [ubiquinone] cytochrome b small subunit, mitochondrial-like [Anopheles bellator]
MLAAGRKAVQTSAFYAPLFSSQIKPRPFTVIALRRFAVSPARNASAGGSSNVGLWRAERVLSVALLGALPVGLMYPSYAGDTLIAVSIVMHQHWGLEAIVTDYVRPILFGKTVPKIAHGLLLILSAATLGGLLHFNYNDIGIGACVRKLWKTKAIEH